MSSAAVDREYLDVLADGTVKQRNPFTGTEVWTVPGRANRPLSQPNSQVLPLQPGQERSWCAFCVDRYRHTPPERSRLVRQEGGLVERVGLPPAESLTGEAEFRRIPNLFEILPLAFWQRNHALSVGEGFVSRRNLYMADPLGRQHLTELGESWAKASGRTDPLSEAELADVALGWFASGHEVVVPRRHFIENATTSAELSSSGCLSIAEHRDYMSFSVRAMHDLYTFNSSARYVAVFQNWLKPAGASFDHLHKQVVAIDEFGPHVTDMATHLRRDPAAANRLGLDLARRHHLLLAANDHAVAWVGIGHRYPAIEVWSRHAGRPWEMPREHADAMSDLVHAVHAAAGPEISCNEEWMHRPPGCDEQIVWRVLVKWRISTLAGFEGATRVYLNTLAPDVMRDRLLPRLAQLRAQGAIAPMQLGDEVEVDEIGSY